ncbi:hypothetical protein MTP99_005717 [Tenebrio molitor]|nr:hypothetical protein MTP99_005717 [Tenebrio molitor]
MGRTIADLQSGGRTPDLNDCFIKTDKGTLSSAAQFERTLAVIRSGPGDLDTFNFLIFSHTTVSRKSISERKVELGGPGTAGIRSRDSFVKTLEKTSAKMSATTSLLSVTEPVISLTCGVPTGPDS